MDHQSRRSVYLYCKLVGKTCRTLERRVVVLVKVRTIAFKKLLQVGKNLEVVVGKAQLARGIA